MHLESFELLAAHRKYRLVSTLGFCLASLTIIKSTGLCQDRLPKMPGYDRYTKMRSQLSNSIVRGSVSVEWLDGGKACQYSWQGARYKFDITSRKLEKIGVAEPQSPQADLSEPEAGPVSRSAAQERGRQVASQRSPDGKWEAVYKDRNLWLRETGTLKMDPVTTEGSDKARVKFGTGSWVYGEELGQRSAMWWSPDGRKLAFYRFDESLVPDFHLQMKQTTLFSVTDIEAYPKPGSRNPAVDLLIYDRETKKTLSVDVRDGRPFGDNVMGHYVYSIRWSPDGNELLFFRANRRQNATEFVAADPLTGKVRTIVREERAQGWVENLPSLTWLKDEKRFLWVSEQNGYRNFHLYDISGKHLAVVTNHMFDISSVYRVDETNGLLYYLARSGDNPMKMQLHRVGLDGRGDVRLTDPKYNHQVSLAPDGASFVDVIQTHAEAPLTRVVNLKGEILGELAQSDLTKFQSLGLKKTAVFTYVGGDGKTTCYGKIQIPSELDPTKKYPVLISIYGGPQTSGVAETFQTPDPLTELGFIVATFDGRNSSGRGRAGLDALYGHLGVVEIDDLAAGVRELRKLAYVDPNRIGIHGTSYGGYFSLLFILRYPDLCRAACASSPVTDWRQYDSIYSERYMGMPDANASGYDEGSAMTYASKLAGKLMLYYGTADNNVHPNNSMQLIKALQRSGKSFEVQVGPDQGHSGVNQSRMLEFFIDHLVIHPNDP